MNNKKFSVTKDHLMLLRNMYVSWYDCEYGAPTIDPKQPYGNSDVESDILKILGYSCNEDGEYQDKDIRFASRIHGEMETVLQILVYNCSIYIGTYENEDYSNKWELIK